MARLALLLAVLLCFTLSTSGIPTGLKSLSPNMSMRQLGRGRAFESFASLNRRPRRARSFPNRCGGAIRSSQFRTQNGFCNNVRNPSQGAADQPFIFLTTPLRALSDTGPNPRTISNVVCQEEATIPNDRGMSELVTFFGQFLDHTVTFVPVDRTKPLNIPVPSGDPVFTDEQYIPFFRSVTSDGAPLNELSSYVDAASVYGVGEQESRDLRELSGGRLLLPDNFLPKNEEGQFEAGDGRVNENGNLIAVHTIFAREHNTVAAEVIEAFPNLANDDEAVYQLARHIVAAEIQAIVYHEFIPALTGSKLAPYRRYDPNVKGVISNEFSTAAFRVGHTLLNTTVTSVSPDGVTSNRLLRDSFFNVTAFEEDTLEGLFRGMMTGFASEVDNGITGEVRNFLIDEPESMEQLDLPALNVQRGLDHGLPRCNEVREQFGLAPFTSFSQISSNEEVVARLQMVYENVNDVDMWICGISEDHAPGSSLGALFNTVVRSEFTRLRDGDRFYFERSNYFRGSQRQRIPTVGKLVGPNNQLGSIMKMIIARNSDIPESEINNPFFV